MNIKAPNNRRRYFTLILIIVFTISILPIVSESDSQIGFAGINISTLRRASRRAFFYFLDSYKTLTNTRDSCYVSQDQTVVEWKSTFFTSCSLEWGDACVWPPSHKHKTYKITIPNGTPIRDKGNIVPAINGKDRWSWTAYDASQWNELELSPHNNYIDYEPIAENEYVIMVETRYRLFNNVETSLGICMQEP